MIFLASAEFSEEFSTVEFSNLSSFFYHDQLAKTPTKTAG